MPSFVGDLSPEPPTNDKLSLDLYQPIFRGISIGGVGWGRLFPAIRESPENASARLTPEKLVTDPQITATAKKANNTRFFIHFSV